MAILNLITGTNKTILVALINSTSAAGAAVVVGVLDDLRFVVLHPVEVSSG